MKKLSLLLVLALSLPIMGKAQNGFFIGGKLTLFYVDGFVYENSIHGGYEFNDKTAVMAMAGIAAFDSGALGEVGLYARLTAWHNDFVFIDFKPSVELVYSDAIDAADIGIVPSVRFRVAPKWDVFADVGALGARYLGGEWTPRIGINTVDASVGINYRF